MGGAFGLEMACTGRLFPLRPVDGCALEASRRPFLACFRPSELRTINIYMSRLGYFDRADSMRLNLSEDSLCASAD